MTNIEQPSYLKSCVDTMLAIESLSDKDRKDLDAIKKSFEKPANDPEKNILSAKNILLNLEKKIDQMHDIDKKKVLEVKKSMQEHTSDLASLKADVLDPQKKIDEFKKKTIDTLKQDLEKHWRSKWLAEPIYNYLIEKHIDKKPVSPLKDWIAKYIGIPLVGLFVPSSVTTLLEKMETLSLDDISGLATTAEQTVNTLASMTVEQRKKISDSLALKTRASFEKLVWHPIDAQKFNHVVSVWVEKWKWDISQTNQNVQDFMQTGTWNPIDIMAKYIVIWPLASFDLLTQLADQKIISWQNVAVESVERSGKTMFRIGMSSFGLFSRYFDCVFGDLSANELTDYVKTNVSGLSIESKAAMWWMVYRHGGIFWNLVGKVGQLTWEVTSLIMSGKTSGDISKFSAYWNAGVWGKLEKEIKVIDDLERHLMATGMFNQQNFRNSGAVLHDLLATLKQNTQIFALAQDAKNSTDLISKFKANNITQFAGESIDDFVRRFDSLAKLKTAIWHTIGQSMNVQLYDATTSFGKMRTFFAKHLPHTPWSKYPIENEFIDIVKSYTTTQEKLLKNENLLQKTRNFIRKFEHGKNLANVVEHGEKVKFHLKTVSEAKDFFDNVAYLSKSSPEVLRTLFKWFPLIMVGKDVLDASFSDDPKKKDQSLLWSMAKAVWYVTPMVGPIMLVHDSLTFDNWQATDVAGAGIWAGMLAYDSFCAVKASYVKGWLLKYFASPVRDSVSFVKSLGQWTYTMFKMSKDLLTIARVEWLGSLWKAWLNYLRSVGLKIGVIALLVFAWYLTWKEFFDGMSEEEKKMFAGLQDKSPEEREKWIAEQWKTMPDDQKSLFLKVATAQRLWFQDPELIDVKKEWTTYTVKVKQLVSSSQLAQTKFELQQAVDAAEWSVWKTTVQYILDGGALEARLEQMTKDGSTKDQIKAYLLELGYSVQDVDQMIKKV